MARKTANAELVDLTLRRELGLHRFQDQVVRDILKLLEESVDDLEAIIRRRMRTKAGAFTTTHLREMRDELRAANREAYAVAQRSAVRQLELMAQGEAVAEAAAIEGVVERAITFRGLSLTRPSPFTLKAIVTERPWEGKILSRHWDKIAGNRGALLINALNKGLVQQESVDGLVRRVLGWRGRDGRRRGGVIRDLPRAQATSLARTWAGHVSNAARHGLYEENDDIIRGLVWVSTLDDRTTPICQLRDGRAYDLNHKPIGHDLDWHGGPGAAHWQCRSSSVALLRAMAELPINWSRVPTGQRASLQRRGTLILDGRVPANENYPEWLRQQPFEVQAEALRSVTRARFLRENPEAALGEVWAQKYQRAA